MIIMRRFILLFLTLTFVPALVAADPEPAVSGPAPDAEPGLVGNAALFYWQAAALMRQPRNEDQLELLRFMELELRRYPPQVFMLRPELSRLMIGENAVREALALGAAEEVCIFFQGEESSPMRILPHLEVLENLLNRALGLTLVYEYVRNDLGSAETFRDLLQLCAHLDQDHATRSMLAGSSLTQQTVMALEGFFARAPSIEACEVLTGYFDEKSGPLYHPGPVIKEEARRFAAWLNIRPDQAKSRLKTLYENQENQIALDLLATLNDERKAERLNEWITEYKVHLFALAGAVEQPYDKGLAAVRALDKRSLAMQSVADPIEGNPLFELLVPQVERVYDRLQLAEAHWRCAALLAQAARYRALVGRWPDSATSLEAFVGHPLPHDPFSGMPFHYTLRDAAPHLVIRAPKWIAKDGGLAYSFSLAERVKIDNKAVQALHAEMQKNILKEGMKGPPD